MSDPADPRRQHGTASSVGRRPSCTTTPRSTVSWSPSWAGRARDRPSLTPTWHGTPTAPRELSGTSRPIPRLRHSRPGPDAGLQLERGPRRHDERREQVGVAHHVLGAGSSRTRGPRPTAATGSGGSRTPRSTRRSPTGSRSQSTSAIGTAHTQWCDHDDRRREQHGDRAQAGAEHPVAPTPPCGSRPAARPRTIGHGDGQPQEGRRRAVQQPRERAVDRLVVRQLRGARPGRASSRPSVQYVAASTGHRHEPDRDGAGERQYRARPAGGPTADQHEQHDEDEWRQLRRRRRSRRARPTSVGSGRSRSTSTASIRNTFTCPNVRFCHTGSSASAPAVTQCDQPPGRRPAAARGRTTTTTAASAPTEAAVHSAAASHVGTQGQRRPSTPPRTAGR